AGPAALYLGTATRKRTRALTQPDVCRLPALLRTEAAQDLTGGELLARFLAGEQAALAVLIHRHGPMVLGVCRRLLRDPFGGRPGSASGSRGQRPARASTKRRTPIRGKSPPRATSGGLPRRGATVRGPAGTRHS